MDGCTAISSVKHVMSFHLRELSQQSNSSAQTQNLDEDSLACFTKIIAEQPSLTQYEQPMYHMKEN